MCSVWPCTGTIAGAASRGALVVDALAWMRGRPVTAVYVNTGLDNAGALALYEDLGFERMDERLTIAARDIADEGSPAWKARRRHGRRRRRCVALGGE